MVNLTKDKVKFKWDGNTESAFKKIQEAINWESYVTSSGLLLSGNYDKQFILTTELSNIANSAVLAQESEGKFQPIKFFGGKLREPEKNYPSLKF